VSHPGSPFWVPSAALQAHVNRSASGHPSVDWLSYVRARYLPAELPRVLVVGCGEGFVERSLARMEGVGAITAVDADAAAVERARRNAARRGMAAVSHAVLDPNAAPLPDGPWDAVIVHDTLHHIGRLEDFYARIHDILSSRGRVVFVEYVGPNRFQYPSERAAIVQRYFRLLPDRLRRDERTGDPVWRREPVDTSALSRDSPFEAARSEELLPLARKHFVTEAEHSGAGGLLHPLLAGLEQKFGRSRAEDERLLGVLCGAEARLEAEGLIPSDFAVFVGRRRSTRPQMT
jgi:SAM-dependent methyltransferase